MPERPPRDNTTEGGPSHIITTKTIALVCVCGAIIVAASGNDGWGWLLFLAFILL